MENERIIPVYHGLTPDLREKWAQFLEEEIAKTNQPDFWLEAGTERGPVSGTDGLINLTITYDYTKENENDESK